MASIRECTRNFGLVFILRTPAHRVGQLQITIENEKWQGRRFVIINKRFAKGATFYFVEPLLLSADACQKFSPGNLADYIGNQYIADQLSTRYFQSDKGPIAFGENCTDGTASNPDILPGTQNTAHRAAMDRSSAGGRGRPRLNPANRSTVDAQRGVSVNNAPWYVTTINTQVTKPIINSPVNLSPKYL